jgi:EAL domain-containing protein (putative c-di-GMP-specific phosphodiesterase class I)/AmiR/NasT family two-component response regulator
MIRHPDTACVLRAIVIDGCPADLEATVTQCRAAGIIVNGWSDCGAGALELIESLPSPPDLVITELDLPDMDGANLLQALSMLEPGLPVVLVSRHSARLHDAALTLSATLGLEALGALNKPLEAPALQDLVQGCAPAAFRTTAPLASRPHCNASTPRPDAGEVLGAIRQHQFELYYQPKTALHDGVLRGAEALLRWRHPHHGLLSPACFLPQAEAANLVDVLTVEVVRIALNDWRRWHADGLALPISINLSPLSLADPHLAEQLIKAVNDAGVPPRAITTPREIGVTSVAEGIELEQDRLLLRALGCDLAQGYLIAMPMPAAALPLWSEKSAAAGKVAATGAVIQLRP